MAVLLGFLSSYSLIILFPSVISLILFVIRGFALFDMSKGLNIKNAWMGFVPVLSVFALGKIAENYEKKDGTKASKQGIVLLIFNILQYIAVFVFIVLAVISAIKIYGFADTAIINETVMDLSMFMSLVPVIICYFVLLAISVVFTVLFYIALYRIYSVFDSKNAILYTVLSVFFSFLQPIFLFLIRKNAPKITEAERMGFEKL